MRLTNKILTMALTATTLLAGACSGNSDDPAPQPEEKRLVLSADKTAVEVGQSVAFKVMYGSDEVTSVATISCAEDADFAGTAFTATAAGTYSFTASHDGKSSNTVTVTATEPEPVGPVPTFERHVCIMEFTGQWCSFCPDGYKLLYNTITLFYPEWEEYCHIIALHDNGSGTDIFAEPLQSVQKDIFEFFNLGGYPSAAIDLREGVSLTSGNGTQLEKAIRRSFEEHPAHCGAAVKSVYDAAAGTAEITAKIMSGKSGSYRLAVFVVEDGIVGEQKDGGLSIKDYTHHHVARRMLSNNWKGDNVGEIAAGKEVEKSYTLTVDPEWNLEKTTVYALAIDAEGQVNNVSVCAVDGGETDYPYAE